MHIGSFIVHFASGEEKLQEKQNTSDMKIKYHGVRSDQELEMLLFTFKSKLSKSKAENVNVIA